VRDMTLKQRLDLLLETIATVAVDGMFPNIFNKEKILIGKSLKPFNKEIESSGYLIYEGEGDVVESYSNNLKGFMTCFFKNHAGCNQGESVREINEKYISQLWNGISFHDFIKKLAEQLNEISGIEDDFYYDAAISSALFLSLHDLEPIQRIDRFVEQYQKFNKVDSERHVYCVSYDFILDDSNPVKILKIIERSLELLSSKVLPSLSFYLSNDMMPTQKVGSKKFKGVPKPFRRLLKSIMVEMVSPFSFKFTCFLKGQTFCVAIMTLKTIEKFYRIFYGLMKVNLGILISITSQGRILGFQTLRIQ